MKMAIFFYKWALIVACALIFILCDAFSASWGRNDDIRSLAIMCILAPIGYFIFGLINRNSNLAVSSGIVNMILIIGTIIISIFYFGDALTIRQSLGLIFAVTAVALMI